MAITAQTMITTAVRRITVASGYALTADEQADFLPVLNAMMDAWGIERLMCYQLLQENFSLVAGTASYTIGTGGTFNTTRPTRICDPCFVRDSANFDSPIDIISAVVYGQLGLKSTGNTYPSQLFYDGADAAGLATIFLYPKPQASLTLYINSWKQLQNFTVISTPIVLPPGYQRAIEWNLCLELCDELGRTATPTMVKNAKESKAAIKSVNTADLTMTLDLGFAGRARSNIFTGV